MNSYTIRNDFHNTASTIRCEGLSHIWNEVEIKPSLSQIKKLRRELCGIEGCTCGDDVGARGPQRTDDGKRIVIDVSAVYAAR